MRAIIQRVKNAIVSINELESREIQHGYVVFIGIENADNEDDINWLSKKIISLRLFDDEKGVMNKSIQEVHGNIMLISQFTLHAKTKKGNRPSYIHAAKAEVAIPIYQSFIAVLKSQLSGALVCGEFGANMSVQLVNDGPVTIIIDTKNKE
ncbi:MAG: D-tyrosyl-tRNA(Tyr) deacylase [Bacteroidetes bacterium CG2_30_33_31]|nr:MAG: D-tyrosyl-tRNA(Tyr) deacylase [Bacteroidetes bacterium CG2_30_33_31]